MFPKISSEREDPAMATKTVTARRKETHNFMLSGEGSVSQKQQPSSHRVLKTENAAMATKTVTARRKAYPQLYVEGKCNLMFSIQIVKRNIALKISTTNCVYDLSINAYIYVESFLNISTVLRFP